MVSAACSPLIEIPVVNDQVKEAVPVSVMFKARGLVDTVYRIVYLPSVVSMSIVNVVFIRGFREVFLSFRI